MEGSGDSELGVERWMPKLREWMLELGIEKRGKMDTVQVGA